MTLKSASKKIMCHGLEMRSFFNVDGRSVAQWFPGHMIKGMRKMQQKLGDLDCIVEVHDARIPLSGRNHQFERTMLGIKPYVLILNKMDLIDTKKSKAIIDYYHSRNIKNVLFSNCKEQKNQTVKRFVPLITGLVENSNRFNRIEAYDFNVMIIGVPNVGKSSLINALRVNNLRKGKATPVGKNPGITRSVLEKIKINQDPLIYLFDTPGILPPHIEDVETGLKLALVNTIREHLVGEDVIADYLLFRMNQCGNHKYVDYLGIKEPTDDIQDVLINAATKLKYIKKIRRYKIEGGYHILPDIIRSAAFFLTGYRDGHFGDLELDMGSIQITNSSSLVDQVGSPVANLPQTNTNEQSTTD